MNQNETILGGVIAVCLLIFLLSFQSCLKKFDETNTKIKLATIAAECEEPIR